MRAPPAVQAKGQAGAYTQAGQLLKSAQAKLEGAIKVRSSGRGVVLGSRGTVFVSFGVRLGVVCMWGVWVGGVPLQRASF